MGNRVLIIDDDIDLCRLLQESLGHLNLEADICADGSRGIWFLQRREYHLIVLDIFMPGMDGFETLEQIRLQGNIPVLMLTARDDNASKVKGLGMGADDYLTKPFNLEEFNARVQALIRRYLYLNGPGNKNRIEYGGLMISLQDKQVVINQSEVILSNKEFDLLVYCAQNPKKILSKKRIFEAVWKQEYLYDDNTVMATMSRLRKKIDRPAAPVVYIQTVKGMGYRFNPPD